MAIRKPRRASRKPCEGDIVTITCRDGRRWSGEYWRAANDRRLIVLASPDGRSLPVTIHEEDVRRIRVDERCHC